MRARRSQGFTLLELMTSVVITIIILLAVAASFTAIQAVYQREAQLKTAVESSRMATGYIERVTKLIGYGIDPQYAIDIGTANLPGSTKSNHLGVTSIRGVSSAMTPPAGTPATTGFVTDDFAFRYRDPNYLRRARYDAGANQVVIDGVPSSLGVVLQRGRLLQLVCRGGQVSTVVKTSGVTDPADTTVTVESAEVAGNLTSFRAPPTAAQAPCLNYPGENAPFLMLVREVRLRIIPRGTAPNIRPFLVAYNSLDQAGVGDTATDFDPIAADVESFQVSYMMNKMPPPPATQLDPVDDPSSGDWVMGNDKDDDFIIPTVAATRPGYETNYLDPSRFNADVANVRAVVFDLSIRSLRPEERAAFLQPRLADDAITPQPRPDGFFHVNVSTTVRTPNLASRSGFTPPLKVASDPSRPNALNEWGG